MATPFIITLDSITVNAVIQGGTTLTLPIYNHGGLSVNWGITNLDTVIYSSNTSLTESNITLDSTTFTSGTNYPVNSGVNFTVTITGNFTKFGAETPPTNWVPESLVSIVQWGSAPIQDLSYACAYASSLTSVPTTLPSTVTNVSYMFYSPASPIYFPDLSWDVSGVTDFKYFVLGNSGYLIDATLSNQNSPFSKAAMKMSFSSAISTLPISGIEGNIGIDWGDGNMTYADGLIPMVPSGLSGTVTVYVYGKFSTFSGYGSNYTQFLVSVNSWGKNNTILTNLSYAFAGAGDLTIVPSELPSSVTNVEGMFQNIYETFTPQQVPTQYSLWNMSNVTSLNYMFDSLYFDTSPSSITNNPPEIGPSTNFGLTISTNTKRSVVTNFTVRYEPTGVKYDSTRTWNASPFFMEPMELVIAGGSGFGGTLQLPISGINGSITVVWVEIGVGTTLNTIQATYANGELVSFPQTATIPSTMFTVRIYGYFTNFSVENIGSATAGWPGSEALNNISAFGANPDLTSLKGAFAFCNSLATGPPVTLPTSVTNLSYLYYKANPTYLFSVPAWNTANVTDVAFAFAGSSIQIQNIALWDISGINTYGKFAFFITDQTGNKDLSISSNQSPFKDKAMAITVLQTYQGAIQLSDIGNDGIAIDYNEGTGAQYVGPTDPVPNPFFTNSYVNGTIYIYGSFGHFGAPDLSGDMTAQYITGITSWGTSNLTSLANAFNGGFNGGGSASTYANDQSNINLPSLPSTVTNLSGMFANCPCAITGISSWDLSGVTNTSYMFYQARNESGVPGKSRFDTDIALWQVNYVTNMDYMFDGAYKFARNISLWDTTGITSTPSFFFSTLTNNLTFDEFSSPAVVDTTTTDLFSPFYVIPPSMTLTFNTSGYVDLPIAGTFTVDWGNGVLNNNTSGTQAGQVKIRGTVTKFGNESDTWPGAAGLTALAGWGDVSGLVSLSGAFNAATSLVSIPTTLPSTVTNLSNMFSMASFFNGDISGWNTAAVTNMSYMFNGALSFNQDITGWDTGAVTNMSHMFSAASAFDKNLTDWDTGSVINMSSMFRDATAQYSNGVLKYNYSGWSVSSVTNRTNFLYINGVETTTTDTNSPFYPQVVQPSMTLTFNGPGIVTLPIAGTFTVDWGDGVLTNSASATLLAAGQVKIRGTVTKFGNFDETWPGADRLTALTGWENVTGLVNLSGAFKEAVNLISVPATLPSTVINLSYMFNEALSFNGDISGWNTAAVTNMSYMFAGATLFNGNISGWNTAAVTDMSLMFAGALAFNQILSDWDTGAVTNMEGMFREATAFNGNISDWFTGSVINMAGMFSTATLFNGDISGWNTGAVKNMSGMFQNATSFDQDLTTWNTESVTDMSFMFQYATAFNSDLSGWNTGAVTNMRGMFDGATAFNGNISTWNTELVTNMSYMFYGATAFNGDLTSDLTSWDTGAVTNMSYMFRGATAFAGYGLESWNTGSVTNMSHMFENAATVGNVFDTWNVSNVTDMSYMFKGSGVGSSCPSWDVSKVIDMSHMFEGTFIDLEAAPWKPKRCANFSYMFAGVNVDNVLAENSLAPWASYIGISAEQINKVNFMTEGTDDITNLTPISPFWSDPNGTNAQKSYVGDVGRGGFPMAISFLCSPGTYLSLPISNQDGEVLIDWGDGQVNWYPPEFTGLYEHYTRISNPEIQLYANFNNFGANLWAGVNKVVSVDGWGTTNKIVNFSNAFKGATILTAVPSILPTTARNLFSMFKGTVLFNQDLSGWDVSRVTDFSDMFFQSIAFGGTGLGKWKPRAAQDMSRMFSGATAFNTNLKPWCAYLGVLTGPVSHINFFTGSDTTNPNSPWYTGYTTAPSRNPLTITFQPTPYSAQNPLIFPPIVSGTAYISLPITGVSGDLFIDWGDGTKNLYSQNQQPTLSAWTEVYEHVDLSGSNHQVKIYGDFATFGERYNGDAKLSSQGNPAVVWFGLSNVLTVDSWGDNAILSSLKQAFQLSAFSLTAVPSNIPRTVKNTASMFLATPLFVGANLALWDVSGLTNTTSMFAGAAAFTADLSGWAYKLGPVSAYDNFFSTTTFGMSGFADPTSQSPRSPFYIGVPTPSNPYVPAAPLVVFNAQPNPTIKVGTEVFGTVGSVLYSLNPSYTRITDLGTSTFVGYLYRPYIANVSISNKIYGVHTGGKLISYDTVTRTLDLSAGSYQGIPTGYMVLDTNGNLYSTDSAGYVYKLAYATPTFVPLNTAALVPPVIGPLSIVNDEFLYGADSDSRLVRLSLPAIDVVRSEAIDMAPTSLIVDSAVKSYFYDTSGQALWSYSPLTKLHDFSGNPLDGTGPVGPIRMDPTKRVLYGICTAGGRGIGTGLRGAGTLFSFNLNSSIYTILVNYIAGDVNRGESPIDFSITTETGTAYVTTRSSSTSFQTRIAPRVANGFGVGSAELPGATTTCFNHGTKILSLINDIEAWVPVESLNIGDLVMTYLHGPRPITHIFKGVMINNPAIWHTCMYKGQKAGFEPLLVTGGHGLLVDYLTEKEQAKQQKFWGRNEVVIDDKIVILAPVSAEFTQIKDRDIYTYYHFVVENDGDDDRRYGVYANGFLTETPSKNQANSKNFKDHPVY